MKKKLYLNPFEILQLNFVSKFYYSYNTVKKIIFLHYIEKFKKVIPIESSGITSSIYVQASINSIQHWAYRTISYLNEDVSVRM